MYIHHSVPKSLVCSSDFVQLQLHKADLVYVAGESRGSTFCLFTGFLLKSSVYHLILFSPASSAAIMIWSTASATQGKQVLTALSQKSARYQHLWAAASYWSKHLSLLLQCELLHLVSEEFHLKQSIKHTPALLYVPIYQERECSCGLFHIVVFSAIPHKEMHCCSFGYGTMKLWVSAKQMSKRRRVLFKLLNGSRCVSCQFLPGLYDILLTNWYCDNEGTASKESIT